VPLVGLETLDASAHSSNDLGHCPFPRDAQSGAVVGELMAEALATALLGLSAEDRARLAAMLLSQQEGK
jgi:hypothetical protein